MKNINIATKSTVFAVLLQMELLHSAHSFDVPTPLVDFAIGGMAGGAGAFAAYPLDYITAQMQQEKSLYKDGLQCLVDTCKEGGPLSLYRGAAIQVMGVAPEKAIKLNVNDIMSGILAASNGGTLPLGGEIISGALAGLCQVVATSPMETLKVALQTSDKTLIEVMEELGGIGGLFRGAEACIVRDIIFSALLFPIYSHLQLVMPDFFAGSIAGVIATFAATPADVVKTRILSEDSAHERTFGIGSPIGAKVTSDEEPVFGMGLISRRRITSATAMAATKKNIMMEPDKIFPPPDRNPFVVGYKIAQKEGPTALLSGVTERCIGSIPRFGLTLSLYHVLKIMTADQPWM